MVHFDRLKRCPSGMRLQEQTSTARAPPGAPNAPSGTHVEPTEVDDEDVESPALTNNTTLQFNHLARYAAVFKQKRPPIHKILFPKKRRSSQFWQKSSKLCRRIRKEQHVVHVMANFENYNQKKPSLFSSNKPASCRLCPHFYAGAIHSRLDGTRKISMAHVTRCQSLYILSLVKLTGSGIMPSQQCSGLARIRGRKKMHHTLKRLEVLFSSTGRLIYSVVYTCTSPFRTERLH